MEMLEGRQEKVGYVRESDRKMYKLKSREEKVGKFGR